MAGAPLRIAETKTDHPVLEIDIEALLAIQRQNDAGLTTNEWAEQLGISMKKMQNVLKVGVPKGLFMVGKRVELSYRGQNVVYTVYQWVG